MKLRNKKTGEIIDSACIGVFKHQSSGDCERVDTEARSLSKFLEQWEDYKPAEPLIKDEKVRKAVRAWADANNYGKDEEYQFEDFSTGWKSWSLTHQNGDANEIHFNGGIDFKKMNHQGYYTITELCGEEEE